MLAGLLYLATIVLTLAVLDSALTARRRRHAANARPDLAPLRPEAPPPPGPYATPYRAPSQATAEEALEAEPLTPVTPWTVTSALLMTWFVGNAVLLVFRASCARM